VTSLRFTEWMRGFAALDETCPERGWEAGRSAGTPLALQLELSTTDVDSFIRSHERKLIADGTASFAPLDPNLWLHGHVNQLGDPGNTRHKTMPYVLYGTTADGRALTLRLVKRVDPPLRDSWKDTTTLYVTIKEGGKTIGAGIVHISLPGFLRQFTTYHCAGGSRVARALAPPRFYAAFFGRLWDVYGLRLGKGIDQ
jgi:cholesterol oxidase